MVKYGERIALSFRSLEAQYQGPSTRPLSRKGLLTARVQLSRLTLHPHTAKGMEVSVLGALLLRRYSMTTATVIRENI